MNYLIKITRDDDGFLVEAPVWHLIDPDPRMGAKSLCTGEFFGEGESGVEYKLKSVLRGVPCETCREIIKSYKKIRL